MDIVIKSKFDDFVRKVKKLIRNVKITTLDNPDEPSMIMRGQLHIISGVVVSKLELMESVDPKIVTKHATETILRGIINELYGDILNIFNDLLMAIRHNDTEILKEYEKCLIYVFDEINRIVTESVYMNDTNK